MQRNYFRGLIVCLIPTLLALYFAVFGEYKKGIDLAGGTILVFEVDKEKTDARRASEGGNAGFGQSDDDLKKLAENIKRRIDPVDTKGVIVRPVGSGRIEILLPFSGKKAKAGEDSQINEGYVQFVKNIVSQAGVLDFRIMANLSDDKSGIEATEEAIARAGPDALAELAKAGKAPPAPDGEYPVTAAGESAVNVRYVWVELGKAERESLKLSNRFAGSGLHQFLAERRNQVYRHSLGGGEDLNRRCDIVLFSRECTNEKLKPADREAKKVDYFGLTRVSPKDKLAVGGAVSLTATSGQGNNLRPEVRFTFNSAGASQFGEITARNKKSQSALRNLAVVLDGMIVSAPTLNAVITDSGTISGEGMKDKEVNELVYVLRSGALNAELKPQPVSENSVGPTLGADTITKGLWAVGLSFAAVMVFMVIYYRFCGLVACIALLVNLLLTVGFMIGVNAAFTLAGLAGIVLMLGMAVDANVLIYERMREERDRGLSLAAAVRNGYDRSFATILDTHITSILTAVVLFAFGNDNLRGFAVSLILGLVISLFTALYVTRFIIDWCMAKKIFSNFTPMQLFKRPNFNPMKYRFQFFTITTILTVMGLALFLVRGEKVLNVDFTRGTSYTARLVDGLPLSGAKEKPGLLDLISEERQKEKLKVVSVVDPTTGQKGADGQTKPSDGLTYTIEYADGFKTTVKLSNKPAGEGADEAKQLDALKLRASTLPDASVEQMTLTGLDNDLSAGTARSFTVRTTEQELRLVEVMLDRLLRDASGKPLLQMNAMSDPVVAGTKATLTFAKPISPEAVKGQLDREFDAGFLTNPAGETFELTTVPSADGSPERQQEVQDGKYKTLVLDVAKNPAFAQIVADQRNAAIAPLAGGAVTATETAQKQQASLTAALGRAQAAFAATPIPDSVQTFDPALAAETRNKAFYAILGSWLIILAYLWIRFGNWTFGLAAVLCLIHDLCFTLGAIALCHYVHALPGAGLLGIQDFKIDLATVAALLTLVGYSVNDTIVVFDRIREVRGKNPTLTPQMINDSVNQTLSRTVLASLTVFLVVGVLYAFGGNGVHLFAFVMCVGVIVGTYSSIFVAAPLLLMFGEGKVVPKYVGGRPVDETLAAPATEKPMAL
jgi:SecD/SecF fusion protein